jgi:hypothetical protein
VHLRRRLNRAFAEGQGSGTDAAAAERLKPIPRLYAKWESETQ